ncbi:MAG: hypothetical protein ABJB55_00130 [Actinomycetota bacterium]
MSGFDNGGAAPPPPPPPSAGGGGAIPQRGLGDILTTAFELYRANAAKLITIVAIVVVPLTFLIALFTSILSNNVEKVASSVTVDPNTGQISVSGGTTLGTSFANSILLLLLTYLLSYVIQYLLTGALTRGAAGSLLGRPVDVKASYSYAFSRLVPLIGLAILVGLVVAGGLILLIIPGIIFAVFLSMAVPAFIVERLGVTASMSRSWNLVKGAWWHTLGVIVVAGIIAGIVTSILRAIGGDTFIGTWIMSAIGQIITAPFVALVGVVLYVDLRSRHEGLTADQLGAQLDSAQA